MDGARASATRSPNSGLAPPARINRDPSPGLAQFLLHGVYDLAWVLAVLFASPWWLWRCASSPAFRAMAHARLGLGPVAPRAPTHRRVLVHGVSVGEVKGAQALVRALRSAAPDVEVVISTITDTGYEVARKTYPDLEVVRFPLDASWVVRRFLRRVDPVCVVLIELEIWPNFLRQSNRLGIPLAVVNGRITDRSLGRYRWAKNLLPQFDRLTLFCTQDEEYAARFRALGADPDRVLVTGNIKVDGLRTGRIEPKPELVRLLASAPGVPIVVAGSTHEPEERWFVEAMRAHVPRARLVLVPRHPERAKELVRVLGDLGAPPQLFTSLRAGETPDARRPVIVDTIGELEQVYSLADLVFVGGSLIPHGGQNMLEPAAQGRPVVFGPHVHNFVQEVALLSRAGACVRIKEPAELGPVVARLLGDPAERARLAEAGIAAVEAQKGATALTLEALRERCLVITP